MDLGSPPHARGRPIRSLAASGRVRITPACAGKTTRPQGGASRREDHPRMRGEYPTHSDKQTRNVGSPRMRGEDRVTRPRPGRSGGITPACAGKTVRGAGDDAAASDHPRMRGEDGNLTHTTLSVRGSPPHARGRLRGELGRHRLNGITPACAGKTASHDGHSRRVQDHPGMRGEDSSGTCALSQMPGSPPHARGRPTMSAWPGRVIRITPACAGKTPL